MYSSLARKHNLDSSKTSNRALSFVVEWANADGIGRLARRFPAFCPPGFAGTDGTVSLGPPDNWQADLRLAWREPDVRVRRWMFLKLLTRVAGNAAFQAGDWQTAIADAVFLAATKAERMRVCGNPNCPAALFIQGRSSQKLCGSDVCADWAQRNYKLNWWREHGEEWRDAVRAAPKRKLKSTRRDK